MTDRPYPPSPPPSSPPPGAPPPSGNGREGDGAGWGRVPLDQVDSPYSVLLAFVSVLIFIFPNLLIVLSGALTDTDAAAPVLNDAQMVFTLVVSLILQLLLFGAALLPLIIRRRLDGRLFGPTRPRWTGVAIGLAIVSGIAATFAAYTVNAILVLLLGAEDPVEQQILQDALAGGLPLILAALVAVVVAPVTEEVIFRGVLFRAMADKFGLWVGAVASSVIFALIHIEIVFSQPIALGGLFLVAMVLAYAYHRTGNLVVPIIGHAVFNAFSLGLALLVDRIDLAEILAVVVLLA